MKKHRIFQRLRSYVLRMKNIVSPGIVQKHAVNSGNRQNDRVGSTTLIGPDHPILCSIFPQNLHNHITESILAYFTHETHVGSENLHGQTRVRYRSAGMNIRVSHLDQFSRIKNLRNRRNFSIRKFGCDIYTDMPRNYNLSHDIPP